ncbi:DnaJ-domain-containing protein [Cylindrobasidium torrendii FP15055 ss-10]|uniref:DnaJ-domain-containing protein n=1 Tax=Cylindrobasidium torrendii FP15055 ss-10 TaxID=1314674 RepID=A0A0D7BV64_9AGAR|nr:DnaJ-domain-containing protein [Cylindrobasidium torrendii FP15055 ss-10]
MNLLASGCRRPTLVNYTRRWLNTTNSPSNPFPFPKQPNPSPHDIFHLSRNASQAEIKKRYYDLVRVYHPDKAAGGAETSAEDAHSRFQAIGHAYDVLRGKKPPDTIMGRAAEAATSATTASRRAAHVRRHRALYEGGPIDDTWKDRIIIGGAFIVVVAVSYQAMSMRHLALEQAREAKSVFEYERRERQRKRARERDPTLQDDPRLSMNDDT